LDFSPGGLLPPGFLFAAADILQLRGCWSICRDVMTRSGLGGTRVQ
jgi:hypothetical protein